MFKSLGGVDHLEGPAKERAEDLSVFGAHCRSSNVVLVASIRLVKYGLWFCIGPKKDI